jgi:hypothetical protein
MAMRDSAIHSWITPCRESSLPNATRLTARVHMASSARSAMPIARMQWWIRPGPSRAWAMRNPLPSTPMRFDAGTRTSVSVISQCPCWSR